MAVGLANIVGVAVGGAEAGLGAVSVAGAVAVEKAVDVSWLKIFAVWVSVAVGAATVSVG